MLTFATPPGVRRHAWPRIFGMYYERLRAHLQSYGKELQPTREQMWQVCEVVVWWCRQGKRKTLQHSLAKFAAFTVCFVPKWLNVRKGVTDTIEADCKYAQRRYNFNESLQHTSNSCWRRRARYGRTLSAVMVADRRSRRA